MKILLFDLDGTLTDSAPGITTSVQYALEKMGHPEPDLEKLKCFVGPPMKEQLIAYAGFTDEEAEQAYKYYREEYEKTGMFDNLVYPGVEELLKYLKEHGCILAVTSSKPEVYCRQIMDHFHLSDYFTEIVGADSKAGRLTKEEVIEEALVRLHAADRRQDVVMVGDRFYDVIGAHACGIQCIGVGYGYGTMDELIKAGVTYVADTVEELEILAENAGEEVSVHVSSVDVAEVAGAQEKEGEKQQRANALKKEKGETQNEPVKESAVLKIWRVAYPILIHFAISVLVTVVASAIVMFISTVLLGMLDAQALSDMVTKQVLVYTGAADLIAIPILLNFRNNDKARRESGRYKYFKGFQKNKSVSILFGTALVGVSLSQILNDVITMSGIQKIFPYEDTMTKGHSIVAILIVVCCLAPIAEELVFRGLVMMRVRDYFGPVAGIVVSALLFGMYHGNVTQFIYAGLLGLFLGLAMEKAQSVWAPIVGHMMANLWSVLGSTVVTAFLGSGKKSVWIADLIMALIFISGLSLILTSGKKRANKDDKTIYMPEKTVENKNVEMKSDEVPKEIPPTDTVPDSEVSAPEPLVQENRVLENQIPESTDRESAIPEVQDEAEPEEEFLDEEEEPQEETEVKNS